MAEGWGNFLLGDKHSFFSAGIKTHGLNPRAVLVMKEVGIDISHQKSQHIDEFEKDTIDIVFTVCSDAHETCPYFPCSQVKHVGFEDPPRLTANLQDEADILEVYRRVRDEIKQFVAKIELHITE